MQVIAVRGASSLMLLVRGRESQLDTARVRIYDNRLAAISEELPALSAIARGYWEEPGTEIDNREIVAAAEALLAA